jgi:hypothetical protein
MAIGDVKPLKQISTGLADKIFEAEMVTPQGREIRLDIWKTRETDTYHSVYVFCANDFIQFNSPDKTPVLVELSAYMAEYL